MPDRLYFTDSDEANALIAADPLALLIGLALDQQVTVQKAFAGPQVIKERVGSLDPGALVVADLDAVFRQKPAVHRFPGTMARRTQELCAAIVSEYGGDAERIWTEAKDARDLKRRLLELPGIGDMKVRSLLAILAKRLGVRPDGWEEVVPKHPTLGDVDSPEALERYQDAKRAYKASLKATRAAE